MSVEQIYINAYIKQANAMGVDPAELCKQAKENGAPGYWSTIDKWWTGLGPKWQDSLKYGIGGALAGGLASSMSGNGFWAGAGLGAAGGGAYGYYSGKKPGPKVKTNSLGPEKKPVPSGSNWEYDLD